MKKVLFWANSSWYLFNFRMNFLHALLERGYQVVLVAPEDEYSNQIRASGFRLITVPMNRKGMNPFTELVLFVKMWRLYKKESPDLAHHYTVKCSLYGSIITAILGRKVQVVNSITGLGHLFLSDSLATRMARWVLRFTYSRLKHLHFLFQNEEDQALFFQTIGPLKSTVIKGSGININHFSPSLRQRNSPIRWLFAGRLLREKGILELIEAANMLVEKGLRFELTLAGGVDYGNPSAVSEKDVKMWCESSWCRWIGHVNGIDSILRETDVVVLPSWREGLPRILLEASAMEKAIIATDVPGCRDVVEHEVTGLLVPVRSAVSLAEALDRISANEIERENFGKRARRKVENEFTDSVVAEKTLAMYGSILNWPTSLHLKQ